MWFYILTGLSIGFAGSLHCIGMCGPLALAMPWSSENKILQPAILYHFGRTLTYMVLGLGFGLLGNAFYIAGYQQLISVMSGVAVLLIVLIKLFNLKLPTNQLPGLAKIKSTYYKLLGNRIVVSNPFLFGLANGLLPCGLVYLALAAALSSGQIWLGMTVMAMFGLGTMPVFTLFLIGTRKIGHKLRFRLNKFLPYLVIFSACLLILRGLNLGIPYISPELDVKGTMPKVLHCTE